MDNSKFSDSIKEYINSDMTDYATMISGEWGAGKTYFLKNELIEKDNSKRFIYISLIGRNDIIELRDDILKKINPFYSPNYKSKALLEAEALEGIVNNGLKKSIPDNIILCFDDLERIDKDFFESAMGYINTFIEHGNVKTIFVCNESKIEARITNYKEVKEKYVRFTYNYNPSLKEKLQNILNEKKYQKIKDIIDRDIILDVFKRGDTKNIRILFFALDVFAKIDSYLNDLNDWEKSGIYNDLKLLVLHYICFYSIERKQRGVDTTILDKISIPYFNPSISLVDIFDVPIEGEEKGETDLNEDKIIQNIQNKYFSKEYKPFEQFRSIAEYIDSGFFNEEKFKTEINDINLKFKNKNIKDTQIRLIEGISDFNLTNEGFLPFIEKLYEEVDKGEFDLPTYLKLYSQLVWLESFKIKGLCITDKETERFKNAVNESVKNGYAKFVRNLKYQVPQWKGESKFNDFLSFVEGINDDLEFIQTESNVQKLIRAIQEEKEEILSGLLSKDSDLVLEENDAPKIFDALLSSEASMNNLFDEAIVKRYSNEGSIISQLPKNENKFIIKLNELIEAENKKSDEVSYSYLPIKLLGQYLTQLIKERESYMKKNKLFSPLVYVLLLLSLLVVFLTFLWFYRAYYSMSAPNAFGTYGDFFGGVIGTIFAIVSIYVVYRTYKSQEKNKIESRFFELLKLHQDNLTRLKSEDPNIFSIYINNITSLIKHIKSYSFKTSPSFEDVVKLGYILFFEGVSPKVKDKLIGITDESLRNEILEIIESFDKKGINYGGAYSNLGIYFRQLFQTVTYVNNQEILDYNEKYSLIKILRVRLNHYWTLRSS